MIFSLFECEYVLVVVEGDKGRMDVPVGEGKQGREKEVLKNEYVDVRKQRGGKVVMTI